MRGLVSSVSAIVAARNEEAHIEETVRSLAAQPEVGEIIVVNDHSTDGTAGILARMAGEVACLQALGAPALPSGWLGKQNALWHGAAAAREEWLLITDADVTHLPGSTARALADAREHNAALVSYSPEQEMRAWWERAVIPFIYARLARLFPFEQVNDPAAPQAAANGQYILIRRDAYRAIGGHAADCSAVLDDVALARRAKAAGHRLHFAPGKGIARTRMYSTFRAMWEGWTKNLYPLVGGRPAAVLGELLRVLFWPCVALLCLAGPPWFWPSLALLLLLLDHARYGGELRRNHFPLRSILYYLLAALFYTAALLASAWRYARGSVVWKGREYPVASK